MMKHRLIEQMLNVIQRALERVVQTTPIDPYSVDTAKEDRNAIDELIVDHIFSSSMSRALVEANIQYTLSE
jgi:hypothetical protein